MIDVIVGSEGDDVIDGGVGNDVICALGGSDELTGGEGDDRLFGGLDRYEVPSANSPLVVGDTVIPGLGNDHVDAGWDERQSQVKGSIWTMQKLDTLDFADAGAAITADLVAGTIAGEGTTRDRPSPPGGQGHVVRRPDHRQRRRRDDLGGGGADVVDSGAGDDTLYVEGADTIDAGAGHDDIWTDKGAGAVSIDAGSGDDVVSAHGGALLLTGGAVETG